MNTPSPLPATLISELRQRLTQSPEQAALDFAAALTPLVKGDAPTPLQRVQLGFGLTLAHYRLNRIPEVLAASREALELAANLPWPKQTHRKPPPLPAQAGLDLLQKTLATLCAAGIRAFPTDGTLLGLVREGHLLKGDKDLDIALPFSEYAKALEVLPSLGWRPAWIPLNAVNFRAFTHAETGITLDMIGYSFDRKHGKVIAGWWLPNRPLIESRLLEFSDFRLVQRPSAWGPWWIPKDPETLMEEKYGPGWRQPDPDYECILGTPALACFNTFTRALGYLRLLESWLQGNQTQFSRRFQSLASRDAQDPVVLRWRARHPTEHAATDLVGGTIGVYDLLHVGHLRFLQTAKSQCSRLKVGVATASTAWRSKQAVPVIPEEERLELVRALACVDEADLFDGQLADTEAAVDWIRSWGVRRMFVSQDWVGSDRWLALEPALAAHGIGCVWIPYTQGVSSSTIKERIRGPQTPTTSQPLDTV